MKTDAATWYREETPKCGDRGQKQSVEHNWIRFFQVANLCLARRLDLKAIILCENVNCREIRQNSNFYAKSTKRDQRPALTQPHM